MGMSWIEQHDGPKVATGRLPVAAVVALAAIMPSAAGATTVGPPRAAAGTSIAESWGSNWWGQLGNGSGPTSQGTPGQVKGVTAVRHVSAGLMHALAVRTDGTVLAWGSNSGGELGTGTTGDRNPTPVKVPVLANVTKVATGQSVSLALKSDGSLWAWGDNQEGQLGDGTHDTRTTPVRVLVLAQIKAMAMGAQHGLALQSDGTVWSWGRNNYGQLGNGAGGSSPVPVNIPGLAKITAIAAGGDHAAALRSDGTVWAWGDNHKGQVGDGTNATTRTTPVQVKGLTKVVAISGGQDHTLALRSDGTVWNWGADVVDGSLHPAPVQVAGLKDIAQISAGYVHDTALRGDGTVKAWGENADGALGGGTSAATSGPVTVPGLESVTELSNGWRFTLALLGPPTVTAGARITGTSRVGSRLACHAGFVAATSVAYAWLRDGTIIRGAAKSAYVPKTADRTHKIACRAAGSDARGTTTSTSAAVKIR